MLACYGFTGALSALLCPSHSQTHNEVIQSVSMHQDRRLRFTLGSVERKRQACGGDYVATVHLMTDASAFSLGPTENGHRHYKDGLSPVSLNNQELRVFCALRSKKKLQ